MPYIKSSDPSNAFHELRDAPMRKVTFFEKKYTDQHDFKKFTRTLIKMFESHQIYGNNLVPAAPLV